MSAKKSSGNARAVRDLLKQGRAREALQMLNGFDDPAAPKKSLLAVRARLLVHVGDLAEAEPLVEQLGNDEESFNARADLARGWLEEGNAEGARRWLEVLTDARPDRGDITGALAIACAGCGDETAAEAQWGRITSTEHATPDLARQVARGFWLRGLHDPAGRWLRIAAERAGSNLMELARAGVDARLMNCLDVAVDLLRTAHVAAPEEPLLAIEYGVALVRSGEAARGRALLEGAVARVPELAEAQVNLAEARREDGDLEGSLEALESALALDPALADAQGNLAVTLLELERYDDALPLFEERVMLDRLPARSLSFQSITLNCLGRQDEADAIIDIPGLLTVREMGEATDHDVAAFNARLAEYLSTHPSLRDSPAQHATRGGLHSGELFNDDQPELRQLKAWFDEEAARYADALSVEDPDAFVEAAPEEWDLTAWCVLLDGGGYQKPHIHTSAWLSGVYYVQLPDELGGGEDHKEGWLEFGIPDRFRDFSAETRLTAVEPLVGRLVLFPSHFHHRTVPVTHPGRTRISIAFDLLPRD